MDTQLIQKITERRDEVHRQIERLRRELVVLEARAEELESVLAETMSSSRVTSNVRQIPLVVVSPPKIAIGAEPATPNSILLALDELEEAGYEHADRKAILKIVRRDAPNTRPNTIRVAFLRLIKSGRIERFGNLYCLTQQGRSSVLKQGLRAG